MQGKRKKESYGQGQRGRRTHEFRLVKGERGGTGKSRAGTKVCHTEKQPGSAAKVEIVAVWHRGWRKIGSKGSQIYRSPYKKSVQIPCRLSGGGNNWEDRRKSKNGEGRTSHRISESNGSLLHWRQEIQAVPFFAPEGNPHKRDGANTWPRHRESSSERQRKAHGGKMPKTYGSDETAKTKSRRTTTMSREKDEKAPLGGKV